jgi:hypothetical protein
MGALEGKFAVIVGGTSVYRFRTRRGGFDLRFG